MTTRVTRTRRQRRRTLRLGLTLCCGACNVVRNFASCQLLACTGVSNLRAMSVMSSMQRVIARMALTASPVELCTEAISWVISPVALHRQIPIRPPSVRLAYFQGLKKTPVPIAASSLAILSGRLAAQLRATVAMLMCAVGAGMERHLGDVFPAVSIQPSLRPRV